MQKNDKYYTFLLKQNNKSGIYFRRVEVSKQLMHFGSVGVFLFVGMITVGLGVSGLIRNTVLAKSIDNSPAMARLSAPSNEVAPKIDYSRPTGTVENVINSGGPELTDGTPEDAAVTAQLKAAVVGMDAAFLPTVWPHVGKINNEFGFRRNPFGGRNYEFHPGMDIDGQRGEVVNAPANGTVIKAGWTGGYGNMIEILHGNGISTRYGHLSKIDVAVGDSVTRGQLIGLIGSTGRSTGPHLHFELRLNDKSINPRNFLPQEPVDIAR